MRGLITASLKMYSTCPNDNDELIVFRRGSVTSVFFVNKIQINLFGKLFVIKP